MIDGTRLKYDPYLDSDTPEAELGDVTSVRRQSFDYATRGMYVAPDSVSYGDYGGSMINVSNLAEFADEFSEHLGTEWWNWSGGHGSRGIIVRVDADERVPEIGEFFAALSEYPSINDERLSELEQNAIEEAWNRYGRADFLREMVKLEPALEPLTEADDDHGHLNDALERVRVAFDRAANESPEVEDAAGSVSFRVYDMMLKELAESDSDALLVMRELATFSPTYSYSNENPLDYLVSESSHWKKSVRMPAFYYALMEFNPKAAREIESRPNAREFAEAFIETYPQPVPASVLDYAREMSNALGSKNVSVIADAVEEGDIDAALELLE